LELFWQNGTENRERPIYPLDRKITLRYHISIPLTPLQGCDEMLVLTRRPGEQILIGGELVTVTVLSIEGNKVRLGIEAPRELNIVRSEIADDRPQATLVPSKDASHAH
jgi:carbon storage regulator